MPIHTAVTAGNSETVLKLLMWSTKEVHIRTKLGKDALDMAETNQRELGLAIRGTSKFPTMGSLEVGLSTEERTRREEERLKTELDKLQVIGDCDEHRSREKEIEKRLKKIQNKVIKISTSKEHLKGRPALHYWNVDEGKETIMGQLQKEKRVLDPHLPVQITTSVEECVIHLERVCNEGYTSLHLAAEFGDEFHVKRLLRKKNRTWKKKTLKTSTQTGGNTPVDLFKQRLRLLQTTRDGRDFLQTHSDTDRARLDEDLAKMSACKTW